MSTTNIRELFSGQVWRSDTCRLLAEASMLDYEFAANNAQRERCISHIIQLMQVDALEGLNRIVLDLSELLERKTFYPPEN